MSGEKFRFNGVELAQYNPHGSRAVDLPVLHGHSLGPTGVGRRCKGELLCPEGRSLLVVECSREAFMPGDLGCYVGYSPALHAELREEFPDGYRMHFVPSAIEKDHSGLQSALRKQRQLNSTTGTSS